MTNEDKKKSQVIQGYRKSFWKTLLVYISIIASGGFLYVLLLWKPILKLKWTHFPCLLQDAHKVLIQDNYHRWYVEEVQTIHYNTKSKHTFIRYFINKKVRHLWDINSKMFIKLSGLEGKHSCHFFIEAMKGLTMEEVTLREAQYGPNKIHIEIRSVLDLLLYEALNPYYIFQVYSVIIWMIAMAYLFSSAIIIMSVISITIAIWDTRKQSKALREKVTSERQVRVLRDKKVQTISSVGLVPGDVLLIPENGCMMECDAVLTRGSCIVNESILSGESIPQLKSSLLPDSGQIYSPETHRFQTLYAGTQILQAERENDKLVTAIVVRTGYSTAKGKIVRSILFPKPADKRFHSHVYKFFFTLLALGVLFMIYTSVMIYTSGAPVSRILMKAFESICFIIPPLLPAAITVGNTYAQRRLKRENIYCISSKDINVCGGVDIMCFDKTGTLTTDELNLKCVIPVEESRFSAAIYDFEFINREDLILSMVTCHSLSIINDKLLGSPMDIQIFEAVNGTINEIVSSNGDIQKIYSSENMSEGPIFKAVILRHFQFQSELKRMTVICQLLATYKLFVAMKGAPEVIVKFCNPQTVPLNFSQQLEDLTAQGWRVIAIAGKYVEEISENMVPTLEREEIETDLNFLGLLVTENKLKPETTSALEELCNANIRTIMVTGDNLLTSLCVANECNLIHDRVIVLRAEINEDEHTLSKALKIHYTTHNASGPKIRRLEENLHEDLVHLIRSTPYTFALDGETFAIIREYNQDLFFKIVQRGAVFARMLPDQKVQLVETLQHLDYVVGMCGDGANDCGALKTAHCGVSLSIAEASVASTFTATKTNIQCIATVLKEGRAALVTSIGVFKFLIVYMYGFITCLFLFYTRNLEFTDTQYVITDFFFCILVSISFGNVTAFPKLVKRPPPRSIMSSINFISVMSFLLLFFIFFIFTWFYIQAQPWYEPYQYNSTIGFEANHDETSVFLMALFQLLMNAVVFAPGPPYAKSFLYNRIYTITLLLDVAVVIYVNTFLHPTLQFYFQLKDFDSWQFRICLLSIASIICLISYFMEILVLQKWVYCRLYPYIEKKFKVWTAYKKIEDQLSKLSDWPPEGMETIPLNQSRLSITRITPYRKLSATVL